jgi:hypothetical protein
MSHGPSITVYDSRKEYLTKNKTQITDLMSEVDIGTLEERIFVANYITDMLSDAIPKGRPYLFAFWNHGDDQEVADYDVLCDLFEAYGMIVCEVIMCTCFVTADGRDYRMLCSDSRVFKLNDDMGAGLGSYVDKLKLKADVSKGKKAEEQLKKAEEDENDN